MSELILAIIGTVMFAIPLIMIFSICDKTIKELNDSLEKERQLWEEYYELERERQKDELCGEEK
jgi:hypothetical protein